MRQCIRQPNLFGHLTSARLRRFEATLKVRLPPDYRAFLLANNGGCPEQSHFRFKPEFGKSAGRTREADVDWFFAIHDRPGKERTPKGRLAGDPPSQYLQPLDDAVRVFRAEQPRTNLVPIGRDRSGNLILLGCGGATRNLVFYYDRTQRLMFPLGLTFRQFLHSLRPTPKVARARLVKPRAQRPRPSQALAPAASPRPATSARTGTMRVTRDVETYFALMNALLKVVTSLLNDSLNELGLKDLHRRKRVCEAFAFSFGELLDYHPVAVRGRKFYPLVMFSERLMPPNTAPSRFGVVHAPTKTDEFHALAVDVVPAFFDEDHGQGTEHRP